jgi:flavin reductase (DIM6/NTAB) family NADH-FMN oxidoreductase RutF
VPKDKLPEKVRWKPGNLVNPAPAALVSCVGADGAANLITIGWCGNINSTPPMLSISVRPERHSHRMIVETGEFVVNLAGKKMARAVDYCGVVSGRDRDKWSDCALTPFAMENVACPGVAEAPISIGCKVTKTISLGSHDMFVATVEEVAVNAELIDAGGKFLLDKANLLCFAHGDYYTLGERTGYFGWSVRKKSKPAKAPARRKKTGKS